MPVTIKTPEEIGKMRVAGRLAMEVLEMIAEHVRAGVTTDELNERCHRHITEKQDAVPAPLDYQGFPKSVCTSVNHQVCRGIPSDLLVINKTDLAPLVGADLGVMARDAQKMRGERPFRFTNLKAQDGVDAVVNFVLAAGGFADAADAPDTAT